MTDFDDRALTEAVVRTFDATSDPRLKTVMVETVHALHDLVRRLGLTFEEWQTAIDFLTRTGQTCTPSRQEFILLSDVLGVSMLVDALNHRDRAGATETTVLGPFYVGEHKVLPAGANIADGVDGTPLFVTARVVTLDGRPLVGAAVDVWHADETGFYDSQKPAYDEQGPSLRARFLTDGDGRLSFRTILPCSYPIPTDGPVGQLIRRSGRPEMRPAHIHFLVAATEFEPLVTHVFIDGDAHLRSDVVFGVKDELVAVAKERTGPMLPDGSAASGPWHEMSYEFRMKPGAGVAPRPMAVAAE